MFELAQAAPFPEQVTTNQLLQNVVYASGTVGALMVVVGLVILDAGSVRRANVFNATIEKLVGFFIGFATYFLIGFALWNWQYNEAFEVPNALGQSIEEDQLIPGRGTAHGDPRIRREGDRSSQPVPLRARGGHGAQTRRGISIRRAASRRSTG